MEFVADRGPAGFSVGIRGVISQFHQLLPRHPRRQVVGEIAWFQLLTIIVSAKLNWRPGLRYLASICSST